MAVQFNPFDGTLELKPPTNSSGGAVTSVNGQVGAVVLDSDDIPEGSTNLYFTDERAQDAVGGILVDTATIQLVYSDATPSITANLIPVGTPGTYVKVTTDASGRVTSGSPSPLTEADGGTGETTYVVGDLLYAQGTNDLGKLAIGQPGQVLKTISGVPAWQDWIDGESETKLFEDWIADGVGQLRWLGTPVGAGANNLTGTTVATNAHPGVLELVTGTTAAGQAARYLGGVATGAATAGFVLGGGIISHEWLIRLEDLSTGTDRYTFDVGLIGTQTLGADSVRIRYVDTLFGGNWGVEASSANVNTSTDSGVPVVADTWIKLRIEVNAAGTSVSYYIDGALVGTNVTNIPTVVVAPRCRMLKSIGTTSRAAYVDYFKLYQRFTTSRG